MMRRASSCFARFARDRRANVATLFGISAIPLIGLTGLGIDYGYMLTLKAKLDQSADAAAVAGANTASAYVASYTGTSDVWSQAQAAGQKQATAQFQSNLGSLPVGTLSTIAPNVQKTNTTITSTLNYSFKLKPFVMGVLGAPSMTVAGTSVSKVTMPTYVNVFVVIDNSESMGIGATGPDQQAVYNITSTIPGQRACAVACHFSGSDTESVIHAQPNPPTLRIDVAKKAVMAGLKSIPSGSTYKVAIYTMSSTLQNVFSLSSNIAGAITAVDNIDLETDLNTGGTNTTYSLQSLLKDPTFKTAGDGLTSQTAQGVVMFITDAVQDSDTKVMKNGSLTDANDQNFVNPSPCNQQGTSQSCYVNNDFSIPLSFTAFDYNQCQPIKNANYTVMTLDVQYLVPDPSIQGSVQGFRTIFSYISTYLASSTSDNMKRCASTVGSTTYAYSANTPDDIKTAVSAMFGAIPSAAVTRLTQ